MLSWNNNEFFLVNVLVTVRMRHSDVKIIIVWVSTGRVVKPVSVFLLRSQGSPRTRYNFQVVRFLIRWWSKTKGVTVPGSVQCNSLFEICWWLDLIRSLLISWSYPILLKLQRRCRSNKGGYDPRIFSRGGPENWTRFDQSLIAGLRMIQWAGCKSRRKICFSNRREFEEMIVSCSIKDLRWKSQKFISLRHGSFFIFFRSLIKKSRRAVGRSKDHKAIGRKAEMRKIKAEQRDEGKRQKAAIFREISEISKGQRSWRGRLPVCSVARR